MLKNKNIVCSCVNFHTHLLVMFFMDNFSQVCLLFTNYGVGLLLLLQDQTLKYVTIQDVASIKLKRVQMINTKKGARKVA